MNIEELENSTKGSVISCLSMINRLCKMKSELEEEYTNDSRKYAFEENRRQTLLHNFMLTLERQYEFLKKLEQF